jgi:hypothetical protein
LLAVFKSIFRISYFENKGLTTLLDDTGAVALTPGKETASEFSQNETGLALCFKAGDRSHSGSDAATNRLIGMDLDVETLLPADRIYEDATVGMSFVSFKNVEW